MDIISKIEEWKLVPVAVVEDEENAVPLGGALLEAGLPLVEVTFRTDAAAGSIARIKREMPEIRMGAGTVLCVDQVKAAVDSGAEFIVTPGYNPTVVDYCVENRISIVPGLNSPTFVEWGLERGLDVFKFYPADFSGGPKMVQLLAGPYPTARFMPTGGINNQTIVDYLRLKNVIACGGSWIVKKGLISGKKFAEITRLTREALNVIRTETA